MANCKKCGTEKQWKFRKDRNHRESFCVPCRKASYYTWKLKDPARYLRARAHGLKQQKSVQLKTKFGISLSTYKEMLIKQNNKCAICNKEETTKNSKRTGPRALSVDHCHKTNKVRALLCASCNSSLGLLKENFEVIIKMAKYVQDHNGDGL